MSLGVVRFGKEEKALKQMDNQEGRKLMRKLYRTLVAKPDDGLIVQRTLREYNEDSIVLIKPN